MVETLKPPAVVKLLIVIVVEELLPTSVMVDAPAPVLIVLGNTALLNVTAKVSPTPMMPTVLPLALVLVMLVITNVAPVVPVKAPEFSEDLPPRRLTLPRTAVKALPDERLAQHFEVPEYLLSNNKIGLLPGFTPLTDRWRLPGTGLGNMPFKRYKDPRLESTPIFGWRS